MVNVAFRQRLRLYEEIKSSNRFFHWYQATGGVLFPRRLRGRIGVLTQRYRLLTGAVLPCAASTDVSQPVP